MFQAHGRRGRAVVIAAACAQGVGHKQIRLRHIRNIQSIHDGGVSRWSLQRIVLTPDIIDDGIRNFRSVRHVIQVRHASGIKSRRRYVGRTGIDHGSCFSGYVLSGIEATAVDWLTVDTYTSLRDKALTIIRYQRISAAVDAWREAGGTSFVLAADIVDWVGAWNQFARVPRWTVAYAFADNVPIRHIRGKGT
jgi:hypothetical protein